MTTPSSRECDPVPDSTPSVYSCETYYSSAQPSLMPSSWYLLKLDIDRSLKTFDTHFDTSCFNEMEDQLLDCPLESFAALCYQTAVARQSPNDPDWHVIVKPSYRIDWQEDEDTLDSHESLRFASVDASVKLDSPCFPTFSHAIKTKRDLSYGVSFPFLNRDPGDLSYDISLPFNHDPAATMVVPNPHESIHYYPQVSKKLSRRNTLTNVLRRIKSFPKLATSC